ncbi:MAG: hypothetical protein QNJ36_06600 [Calothrix sp. MO_167.B42]|nr:hypothetical protein [Calothrix sp. MO_167.B42]
MKSLYHSIAAISTMGMMLCTLASPAMASETWGGTGQVVRGQNRGAKLRLALSKAGNKVTFHSGPDRNKSVILRQSSARTSNGHWKFTRCGDSSDKLCVTFTQSKRVIYYLLKRS